MRTQDKQPSEAVDGLGAAVSRPPMQSRVRDECSPSTQAPDQARIHAGCDELIDAAIPIGITPYAGEESGRCPEPREVGGHVRWSPAEDPRRVGHGARRVADHVHEQLAHAEHGRGTRRRLHRRHRSAQ